MVAVLNLRDIELQSGCHFFGEGPEHAILDRGARFRIDKEMFNRWLREPETTTLATRVWARARSEAERRRQEGTRSSAGDLYNRSMQSYWKTTLFNRFGGEIWFGLLCVCGRVPLVLIELVNEVFESRIREEEGRIPSSRTRLLTGAAAERAAHASSQGQPRVVRGVMHPVAATKQLREQAQLKLKHAKRHDEEHFVVVAVGIFSQSVVCCRCSSSSSSSSRSSSTRRSIPL